jgi:hypothetical protein
MGRLVPKGIFDVLQVNFANNAPVFSSRFELENNGKLAFSPKKKCINGRKAWIWILVSRFKQSVGKGSLAYVLGQTGEFAVNQQANLLVK